MFGLITSILSNRNLVPSQLLFFRRPYLWKKNLCQAKAWLLNADLIFRQRGDHMSGSGFCFLINTTES